MMHSVVGKRTGGIPMLCNLFETKNSIPAFWYAIITLFLLGFAFAPVALANHGGPITYVDNKNADSEDSNCDFHFKTLKAALNCPLQEFSTVRVDPGVYDEGQLNVNVKGVVIQSSDTAQRTKINGCFNVTAQKVEIRGFDVNAASCDHGITVADREVQLHDNIIHE